MKTAITEAQGQEKNWTQAIVSWVICLSLQSATRVLEITEDANVLMVVLNATMIWAVFSLLHLVISLVSIPIMVSLAVDFIVLLSSGWILSQIFQLSQTTIHLGMGWLTALGAAHAIGTQQFRRALFIK